MPPPNENSPPIARNTPHTDSGRNGRNALYRMPHNKQAIYYRWNRLSIPDLCQIKIVFWPQIKAIFTNKLSFGRK